MARRARVDAELVRRGLARSREDAATLIDAGRVRIAGTVATKAATAVEAGTPLLVAAVDNEPKWASRGAHKLIGALAAFTPAGLTVQGRRCLDAGASTGGFTDVLLHRGAREVIAVDVGYGQLVWRLRTDDRVHVVDRTNARSIDAAQLGGPAEVVVADLSFISLKLVLPALTACVEAGADLVPMVKPQFEVGKGHVGAGGVVRNPELRSMAVMDVVRAASALGLTARDVIASPLPGPSGNVEYFLWLHAGGGFARAAGDVVPAAGEIAPATGDTDEMESRVRRAVQEGPQ